MIEPSQVNPRERLRQAIDTEIKSFEGSIRALRRRRNALAPVSSLPTEIIETIFSLSHVPGTLPPSTLDGKPDHLPWLRVAHVCHQWREIALNQPLFWSHVDFNAVSSAGAAEILTRAKMVPEDGILAFGGKDFHLFTGTMLSLAHSKKNSRITSPTYATLTLAQNTSSLTRHSTDSLHLLPLLNIFLSCAKT